MNRYYVNKNAQPESGDHEVHMSGCQYLPKPENQIPLGLHTSCGPAVEAARKIYPSADGCKYCCPRCHRG
jgi:hypothetical protein